MPDFMLVSNQFGPGPLADMGADSFALTIVSGGVTVGAQGAAITGTGYLQSVVVAGEVWSARGFAINLEGALGNVSILPGARVFNSQSISVGAVGLNDGGQVINEGAITGSYGVLLGSNSESPAILVNTGTVTGTQSVVFGGLRGTAVYVVRFGEDLLRNEVHNSGVLTGSVSLLDGQRHAIVEVDPYAIQFGGPFGAPTLIVNSGSILGGIQLLDAADELRNFGEIFGWIETGGGADTLRNSGLITGDVDLGEGNNAFNGRSGTVLGEIRAGSGNDTIFGGDGDDVITVEGGRNELSGGPGDDTITGGSGNDVLRGGAGDDVLIGRAGNDEIRGGAGDDLLEGRGGDDTLMGGDGNDTLIGGGGVDVLTGGPGADVFVFISAGHIGTGGSSDRITDFESGIDKIDLSGFAQPLTFIGTASFSGTAGEVRFNASAGVLQGDITGNGSLDFRLWLDGVSSLEAGDLIL